MKTNIIHVRVQSLCLQCIVKLPQDRGGFKRFTLRNIRSWNAEIPYYCIHRGFTLSPFFHEPFDGSFRSNLGGSLLILRMRFRLGAAIDFSWNKKRTS